MDRDSRFGSLPIQTEVRFVGSRHFSSGKETVCEKHPPAILKSVRQARLCKFHSDRHPSRLSQSQISSDVKCGGISPFGKDFRAGQLQIVSSCRDVSFRISLGRDLRFLQLYIVNVLRLARGKPTPGKSLRAEQLLKFNSERCLKLRRHSGKLDRASQSEMARYSRDISSCNIISERGFNWEQSQIFSVLSRVGNFPSGKDLRDGQPMISRCSK
jgi:hypothetical protein